MNSNITATINAQAAALANAADAPSLDTRVSKRYSGF